MSKRRQRRAQLRALECLAYSSTLSYLRSQNDFDHETQYLLEHLRSLLHISSHRHLAELKRVIHDEEFERLGAWKYLGESHLKPKWTEEEGGEEVNQTSSSSIRKKFKGI